METYKPNIERKVQKHSTNRDRRAELRDQMGEMQNDYEDMLRAREEYKKQLTAKF